MAQDQLRLVLAAEADARQQLETVRQECQRLVAAAEEESQRRVREARAARDAIAHAAEQQLVGDAQEKIRRIADGARAKAAAVQAHAEARTSQAVEAAIRCILGHDEEGAEDG